LPPVSTILAANLPPTGGKFATGVNKTMGTISGCRYLKVKLKAKMYI
jgi:hypothetical protein